MQGKCPKGHGKLVQDTDREYCVICGHSKWRDFKLRRPTKEDQNNQGRPRGTGERNDQRGILQATAVIFKGASGV